MDISRTTLGIAAGIAGTLFLGYCVYFDQQRRKDPLFKKKSSTLGGPLPDMSDHEAMQRFFLQQKLPEVSERLRASMKATGNTLQEEDVE
ncbi:Mitochondrial import receptor subunit tom20 [Operophtera brumata]|uniref:Mitochondrial import receptor subunit tom20 n=1 Tax=Operophtera brumata TaxID=104452 RepID=A0A0L7LJF7_OPEBR|nr:Mitochondrial import receptor subunit tom20 [Operophtera brumata]